MGKTRAEPAGRAPSRRRNASEMLRRLGELVRERRLPDRVETYLYERPWYRRLWIQTNFRGILRTGPTRSNPLATTEIHTLVCHRDLYQYIGCVKSLLRFSNDLSIMAHDDGTLTPRDRALLVAQVPGIVLLDRELADRVVSANLAGLENCLRYRDGNFIARQLFDFALLSRSGRIVSLDSDTLFLERPDEFLAWSEGSEPDGVYSYEEYCHNPNDYLGIAGEPYPYEPHICAGLMCYRAALIDLPFIDSLLARVTRVDWVTSQMIFLILARRSERAVRFFPPTYQTYAFEPNPVFRHYWGHNGLSHQYRTDMRQVIAALRENGAGGPRNREALGG